MVGPRQRLVEHATYAICLDCNKHVGIHTGRKNINLFNHHALKGRPCQPFKRKFEKNGQFAVGAEQPTGAG
eukprot:1802117-Amphidinium_carterae.1